MKTPAQFYNLAGRLSVWAQVNHPVKTSNMMRKLTASKSSHKKHKAAASSSSGTKIAGIEAANIAARVPTGNAPLERTSGIALANRAARIPGC